MSLATIHMLERDQISDHYGSNNLYMYSYVCAVCSVIVDEEKRMCHIIIILLRTHSKKLIVSIVVLCQYTTCKLQYIEKTGGWHG